MKEWKNRIPQTMEPIDYDDADEMSGYDDEEEYYAVRQKHHDLFLQYDGDIIVFKDRVTAHRMCQHILKNYPPKGDTDVGTVIVSLKKMEARNYGWIFYEDNIEQINHELQFENIDEREVLK